MKLIKNSTHLLDAEAGIGNAADPSRQPLFCAGSDQTINLQGAASLCLHRGFSLIEIMVVLLILAILAAIALPSYQESMRKTRRAEGRAALMAIMQQQERYYSQNGRYSAFSAAEPNGFKWYSADSAASSAYEITGTPCQEGNLRSCVLLTAKPGTMRVARRHGGDLCGELTFASNGIKTATGSLPHCW